MGGVVSSHVSSSTPQQKVSYSPVLHEYSEADYSFLGVVQLSIYPDETPQWKVVDAPSELEYQIRRVRERATHSYLTGCAHLQMVIDRWIGVEQRIEGASSKFKQPCNILFLIYNTPCTSITQTDPCAIIYSPPKIPCSTTRNRTNLPRATLHWNLSSLWVYSRSSALPPYAHSNTVHFCVYGHAVLPPQYLAQRGRLSLARRKEICSRG